MTIHAPDPAQGNLLISERERFDHESQVGEKPMYWRDKLHRGRWSKF